MPRTDTAPATDHALTVDQQCSNRARPRSRETTSLRNELPELPDSASVDTATAKELTQVLFARLHSLEEGTADSSYVRNSLVQLNLGLVRYAASQFAHRSEPMEDIVQVGTVGLIKAINRFEPDRGLEFVTFALPTITGEIKARSLRTATPRALWRLQGARALMRTTRSSGVWAASPALRRGRHAGFTEAAAREAAAP